MYRQLSQYSECSIWFSETMSTINVIEIIFVRGWKLKGWRVVRCYKSWFNTLLSNKQQNDIKHWIIIILMHNLLLPLLIEFQRKAFMFICIILSMISELSSPNQTNSLFNRIEILECDDMCEYTTQTTSRYTSHTTIEWLDVCRDAQRAKRREKIHITDCDANEN